MTTKTPLTSAIAAIGLFLLAACHTGPITPPEPQDAKSDWQPPRIDGVREVDPNEPMIPGAIEVRVVIRAMILGERAGFEFEYGVLETAGDFKQGDVRRAGPVESRVASIVEKCFGNPEVDCLLYFDEESGEIVAVGVARKEP